MSGKLAYPSCISRDSLQGSVVNVNIHRLLRRSTMYGPILPKGVMEDDGQDRGLIFAGICSSLSRQFEFIKTDWLNGGNFAGMSTEKDPITGKNEGKGCLPFRTNLFATG